MKNLRITGGRPLCGEITVQGSKNAVLPILAASLLGEGPCILENCPVISDVKDTLVIMKELGCEIQQQENWVLVDASAVKKTRIDGPEAARIRSSVLFLGALLGKMGTAVIPLPGGCEIGARPIDQHISVLQQLGAQITLGACEITAEAPLLRAANIRLRFPSVGATEHALLVAVMAEGETQIEHAAQEPEVDELCRFLNLRGAQILRKADGTIQIKGGRPLHSVRFRISADRIVTGTYLLAGAAAGGRVCIRNFPHGQLDALLAVMHAMGAQTEAAGSALTIESYERLQAVPWIETAPYPGFPTDLQSPMMAVLCAAQGRSCICERMFENRFRVAEQLRKMGAGIRLDGCRAYIEGKEWLHGAYLETPDLRSGAALVIAALQSAEDSVITGTEYIERGYENIVRDLRQLGAWIRTDTE